MRISRIALLLGSAVACAAQSRDAMFDRLADRYYNEVVFRYSPEAGTQAGFHQYDALLASGARSEIQAQTAATSVSKPKSRRSTLTAYRPSRRPTANCCSPRSAASFWRSNRFALGRRIPTLILRGPQ